jgi:hypothetical protein
MIGEYLAAFLHAVTSALLLARIIYRIKLTDIENERHNLELSVLVHFVDS